MNQYAWYVAITKPSASREAKFRLHTPEERKGENTAERSIRDAGFDCYFPRMKMDIVHHRSKKLIARRFPLFTGYIFVSLPTPNGEWIKDCDGVGSLLGFDGRPWPVDGFVARLRAEEADMKHDKTTEAQVHRGEIERTAKGQLRAKFKRQSKVRVIDGPFSSFSGQVQSVTSRDTIKALIEIFGRMVPIELEPAQLSTDREAA